MAGEAAETHRDIYLERSASDFSPQIAGLIAEGLRLDPNDLDFARQQQPRFAAEMATIFAAQRTGTGRARCF